MEATEFTIGVRFTPYSDVPSTDGIPTEVSAAFLGSRNVSRAPRASAFVGRWWDSLACGVSCATWR